MLFIPDWPRITREEERAQLFALMLYGFLARPYAGVAR